MSIPGTVTDTAAGALAAIEVSIRQMMAVASEALDNSDAETAASSLQHAAGMAAHLASVFREAVAPGSVPAPSPAGR